MAFGLGSIHTKLDTIIASIAAAAGITITPKTLSNANDTVEAGYYEATTLHAVDADLTAAKIKKGTVIFGITGTYVTALTGDAAVGEVKTGKTFYADDGETKLTGNGTKTLSAANDTVAAGYYEATTLHDVDADLITANILAGKTIFGIAGKTEVVDTTEATNPVAAGEMKTGQVGFVNGAKVTGNGTKTLSTANDTVAAGYYAATTLHAVDADLATANIKSGVTIFGIAGASTVVDVADTTAVAADVAAGKFFYLADGTKVEGTKV